MKGRHVPCVGAVIYRHFVRCFCKKRCRASTSRAARLPNVVSAGFNRSLSLFWARITQDGSHGAHNGGAEFAAPFDSCSQRLAELVVLLAETSHSVHAAFLRNRLAPLPHECPPIAPFDPRARGRARRHITEM
jgi:hypothetical protein